MSYTGGWHGRCSLGRGVLGKLIDSKGGSTLALGHPDLRRHGARTLLLLGPVCLSTGQPWALARQEQEKQLGPSHQHCCGAGVSHCRSVTRKPGQSPGTLIMQVPGVASSAQGSARYRCPLRLVQAMAWSPRAGHPCWLWQPRAHRSCFPLACLKDSALFPSWFSVHLHAVLSVACLPLLPGGRPAQH